jgi:hypothetical protein
MNLLPPYQKKAIEAEIITKFSVVVLGIVGFLALFFLVLLYNSFLYINLQTPSLERRLEMEKATQKANTLESVEGEIARLNDVLLRIAKIRSRGSLNFPYILRLIGNIVPAGAELRSIVFQKENISISGHADERAQVLTIKEKLEKEEIFTNVNSPLSNIVKERDINFNFTFTIHD